MGLFGNKRDKDKDAKMEKTSHYYHQEKGDQCSEYGPPALISPPMNFSPMIPMENFPPLYPQQDQFSKYLNSNPFQQGFAYSPMFYPNGTNPMNFLSPSSMPMINQQASPIFSSPMTNPIGMNLMNNLYRDPFNQQQQQQQQQGMPGGNVNPFSPYQQMNYLDPMYYHQNSSPYGYIPSSF